MAFYTLLSAYTTASFSKIKCKFIQEKIKMLHFFAIRLANHVSPAYGRGICYI